MADNDIIDFYKKADNDNKPEEPLKEQVETPEPVVSEAVSVPVPESNDPFDKFLFNLAEKLKTEKKITEQQQQQFNERVVQPTTNPEDPFAKFLESFAGLVKEDENINKEENIKEATIDFINKLKNDDFFDRDIPKVIPKVKQAKSKSKKYLPPKFAKKVEKVEEEQPVIEQSTEPETEVKQPEQTNNPYLKELQTADKKKNKIEDKISGLSDIKKIIAQQVQEQLSKYPNIGFTGGGGGTNAVQYAKGGTMDGDLNVTGKFLSGGVDISTLFSTGGGGIVSGIPDRLIAGSETLRLYSNGTIDFPNDTIRPPDETILTLESENPLLSSYTRVALSPYAFFAYDNEGNSITFDEVDNAIVLTSKDLYEWTFNQQGVLVGPNGYLTVNALSSLGRILSGGKDLLEIFALSGQGGGGTGRDDVNTIVISNSANWNTAYNVATAYQSVSSTFATNNLVNSVSGLLTPLTLTNTLTGQLVTNTTFANYQTSVAESTATLLPTSIYQTTSGQFALSSHASTHYTGGSDQLRPQDIGAQSLFITENLTLVTDITLTADRAKIYALSNYSGPYNVTLPIANNLAGDIVVVRIAGTFLNDVIIRQQIHDGTGPGPQYQILATLVGGNPAPDPTAQYRFVKINNSNFVGWNLVPVDSHEHRAASITSGILDIARIPNLDQYYLPLSGGTLTGNLSVYGNTFINNNLTVGGNLTALGTATFANTIFTTTSALSVVNTGPGPALYVYQAAGPYDVASFYDGDGIEVLHVGNAGPGGLGKVGVNESFPNEELTVRGSISATGAILASAIDISTNILSAGVNLSDIFTGKEYINSNFFPLSGGTVTGKTIISHDGDVVDPNTPYTLSIQRNVGSTWLEILNNGGPNQGAFFGMTSNNFEQWNYQGGDILFYTAETPSDGNERLIIKNNGNVGIGGSNPASRLQVNGTITTDAISFTSPAEFYSTGGSIRFLHIDDTTNSNNDIYFKIEHENSDNQPTGYITIGTRGAVNKARYSGQVSGMTTDVVIRANIGGWDGNSIILTFDGVATIDTVIAIWNAANPSNQVTLISGDGTQIPDNGAVIGLAGGGDAAYIQGQNSEFRIEQAGSNLADIKSRNVILSDGNTYTGTFNAQGKLSNNRTYDLPDADGTLALGNQTLNTTDNVQFNQVNANVYLSGGVNLYNLLSSSGGGGGDPAVNTVVYTYSATWIDTSTVVQTNSASWAGGGGSTEKRFDFVTTGGIDYSYSGTAAQYTIETSPTWKLIRLTYANNGTISNSASAIDSWTGRLTATYV